MLPSELAGAVHGWIRSPRGRSVTIWLAGSPCGGSVAGPSSLRDQRPFFLLKVFCFGSSRCPHQGGTDGGAGFVVGAVFPKRQQQHGEFAGHRDDGAFLFTGAAGTATGTNSAATPAAAIQKPLANALTALPFASAASYPAVMPPETAPQRGIKTPPGTDGRRAQPTCAHPAQCPTFA